MTETNTDPSTMSPTNPAANHKVILNRRFNSSWFWKAWSCCRTWLCCRNELCERIRWSEVQIDQAGCSESLKMMLPSEESSISICNLERGISNARISDWKQNRHRSREMIP